jgi:hypothetical protein
MRAMLLALALTAAGCLPLPTKKNPEHCVTAPEACPPGTSCDPGSGHCIPLDMGPDGSD